MPGYVQYGPFVNSTAPGISAAFLNALETFLLSVNAVAYDANITSDGAGHVNFTGGGKISQGGRSIVDASAGTDLTLNAPNTGGSHKIFGQVGGTNVFSVDSSGNMILKGSLTQNGTP